MNTCDKCFVKQAIEAPSDLLFETGSCDVCGRSVGEVADLDLIDLYGALGLSPEFVHSHLPRLRRYMDKTLTWGDIGREIARHAVFGPCRPALPCSGYRNRPWQFSCDVDGK